MNISDIKKEANYMYEGYLWLSDSGKPIVLDGKKTLEKVLNEVAKPGGENGDLENEKEQTGILDEGANPFINEGYLYSVSLHVSYSIKYVDGKTIVNKYTLNDDYFKNRTTKMFYPNRMGNRMLKFMDVWEPVADPLCEGMEVLQPKVKVFIGFENLKDNGEKKL